jgi:hypothetical protein
MRIAIAGNLPRPAADAGFAGFGRKGTGSKREAD